MTYRNDPKYFYRVYLDKISRIDMPVVASNYQDAIDNAIKQAKTEIGLEYEYKPKLIYIYDEEHLMFVPCYTPKELS